MVCYPRPLDYGPVSDLGVNKHRPEVVVLRSRFPAKKVKWAVKRQGRMCCSSLSLLRNVEERVKGREM